ncbi:RNA polymerase sigma factor [Planctomycetota bacterium]
MSDASDDELVERARGGDQGAFSELVVRHQRAMLGIARAYFASQADAEDAVQDAFVKAFRRLSQLNDGNSFAAWVARITARVCLDTLSNRTDKVSLSDFASTARLHPRLGQPQFTPSTLASREEDQDLVKVAVGHLPENQRIVLMLRFGEGMTYGQIATYLDLPKSTVQGRLHRAKQALRSVLRTLGTP